MFLRLVGIGRKFNTDTFCIVYIFYTVEIFNATVNIEVRPNAISPTKAFYFKTIAGIKIHIVITVCINCKISSFTGAVYKTCLHKSIISKAKIETGEHIFFLQNIIEVITHIEIMSERRFKTGVTNIYIQRICIY